MGTEVERDGHGEASETALPTAERGAPFSAWKLWPPRGTPRGGGGGGRGGAGGGGASDGRTRQGSR